MAFIERFSTVSKGDLIFIGNTLGLSKYPNLNNKGELGSIGAFITTDESLQVSDFPKGTTLDYTLNSSSAKLDLPPHSKILYAELVWSGIFKSKTKDISKLLSQPIIFTTPKKQYEISAEYNTKQDKFININNLTLGIYTRNANVTSILNESLSGTYTAGKIPSIIEPIDGETNNTNFAGWTLIVAYKNDNMPPKLLNVKIGCEIVYKNNIDIAMSGFNVSTIDPNAKLLLSSGEGDNNIDGDTVAIGKDNNNLTIIEGENNPRLNFFCSQINNSKGSIDTNGSFGNNNHNTKNNTNISAGRQGWDITTVDISHITNTNFPTTTIRFSSTKDLFIPNAIGLAVNVKSSNIKINKYSDKDTLIWGDIITYTIVIKNIGDVKTKSLTLFDPVPKYITFVNNSIKVDGVSYKGTFPMPLSNLDPNASHVVNFKVRVGQNTKKIIKNTAFAKYSYEINNSEKINEDTTSNTVCLYPEGVNKNISIKKTVDKKYAKRSDILNYTIEVKNISDNELFNIVFMDNIPNNTKFINGTIKINNQEFVDYNPQVGFNLPTLKPNENITISFQVEII